MKDEEIDPSSELHCGVLFEAVARALAAATEGILERHVAKLLPSGGVVPQVLLVPQLSELWAAQHADYRLSLGPHLGS